VKIVLGSLIVVVVVAALILALPFLIDLNKYQDQYKPLIEDALNRKVQLQDIRLTIWPQFGARVAGFTVLDDPAFGSSPFTSLTSLDVGVKLRPLFGGKVEVEDITLRDPMITIIKNEKGVLNISTIGRTGVELPKTPSRAPIPSTEGPLKILALLAVDRVSIVGGTLTYRDLSAAKPNEYLLQDLQFALKSVHLGQSPSLHFATLVQPFNLPVTLDGTFGPLKETTDVEAIHLQLALGKTVFTVTGSTAGHDANVHINSPVVNTAHVPIALPLKQPVELKNFEIAAAVKGQDV
jgi:AsmA protein